MRFSDKNGSHEDIPNRWEFVGKVAEPCLKLAAGERLDFSFSAAAPLDFNIHYHTSDDRVFFPVQSKAVSSREGTYIAPVTRDYCLMWTNNTAGKPARLEYRFQHYGLKD